MLTHSAKQKKSAKKPEDSPNPKGVLKKSPILWIFPILVIVGIIGVYSLHSGKREGPRPGKGSSLAQTELSHSPSPPAPARAQSLPSEKVALSNITDSLADTLKKAPKAMVFIKTAYRSGCGFFLSNKGIITTNAHILGESDEAEVFLQSGAVKRGVVVKRLPLPLDLALLQIDGDDHDTLPLAASDQCREGEEIMVLGYPGGEKWKEGLTISKGSIGSCSQSYQGVQYLQVDNALNPENNGGPIINKKGEVIGVSKGELSMKGLEGARYGLAINLVKDSMAQKFTYLEEKIRDREQFFKYVYDDLWVILSNEYQVYQKKLYDLHVKEGLSAQEATRLEKRPLDPPAGYSSLKQWVADLTEKVIKGEMTKEKATALVKAHAQL